MYRRLFSMLIAGLFCSGTFAMSSAVPDTPILILSLDGKPKAVIVVPDGKLSMPESRAAADLQEYLKKMSGAEFTIVPESAFDGSALPIRLGRAALKKLGKQESEFGGEEWFVEYKDGELLLGGGAEHGAEYAASRFLEDALDVHWWNGFEEHVPSIPSIAIQAPSLHGRPAFEFRNDLEFSAPLDSVAAVRNRLIGRGWFQADGAWVGWEEKSGQSRFFSPDDLDYSGVHSLMNLVRPSDQVEHPEWFALRDGKRVLPPLTPGTPKMANCSYALCLSNEALRRVVARRLRDRIDVDIARAKELGVLPLKYYNVEQCDCPGGFCLCEKCVKFREDNGSESGNMIDFVNAVAEILEPAYPNIVFTTLAYQATRKAPKLVKPRGNVLIRLTEETVDYGHDFAAPENKKYNRELDDWLKVCGPERLGLWSYENVADGTGGQFPTWRLNLPLPNLRHAQNRLRRYAELRLPYYLLQAGNSPFGDLPHLKMWIHAKLMEDPTRDYDKLLSTFTDNYYGPAGKLLRTYLDALEAAEVKNPSKLWFYANNTEYKYLTLDFLKEANGIFDRAAAAVAGNPTLSRRIACARLSLDRAILYNWPTLELESERRGEPPFINAANVLERLKTSMDAELAFRTKADKNGRPIGFGKNWSTGFANEFAYLTPLIQKRSPLTPPPGALTIIDDYPVANTLFELPPKSEAAMVDDPLAPGGKALRIKLADGKLGWSISAHCAQAPATSPVAVDGLDKGRYEWLPLGTAKLPAITWMEFGGGVKAVIREMGPHQFHALLRRGEGDTILLSRLVVSQAAPPPLPPLSGDVKLSDKWQVFAPLDKRSPPPTAEQLRSVPAKIMVDGKELAPTEVNAGNGTIDLARLLGGEGEGKTAWVYIPFTTAAAGKTTLGFGADWWLQAWVDGKPVCDTMEKGNDRSPPSAADHITTIELSAGGHLAVVRFVSGSASSVLAAGGAAGDPSGLGKTLREPYIGGTPRPSVLNYQDPTTAFPRLGGKREKPGKPTSSLDLPEPFFYLTPCAWKVNSYQFIASHETVDEKVAKADFKT